MIREVVIVIGSPLSQRDYERFGTDTFRRRGFAVRYLDISPVVFGQDGADGAEAFEEVTRVREYSELAAFLDAHRDSAFIILIGSSSRFATFFSLLKKYAIYYGLFFTNAIPNPYVEKNLKQKISYVFNRVSIRGMLRRIIFEVRQKIRGVKPADFIMIGGQKSLAYAYNYDPHTTQLVHSHALDYDVYLDIKDKTPSKEYIVFVDDYIPFHPDWEKIGVDASHLKETYFDKINAFFDKVERTYGREVVIAAHPRSRYDEGENGYWRGRKLFYFRTHELIQKSDFCIMHASTALNYVVLFQKPILFVTMKEIKPLMGALITSFANEIGATVADIDRVEEKKIGDYLFYDDESYARYKENYIKLPDSPEKKHWEICSDFLEKTVEQYETKTSK